MSVWRDGRLASWLVAAAVLLAGADTVALVGDFDERVFYLDIVLESEEEGSLLVAYLNGAPNFEKPPAMYLLARLAMAVFGHSLWALRLPSAVLSFAALLLVARLTRRLTGSTEAGNVALLTGATCWGVFKFSHVLMMDGGLLLATAISVTAATLAPSWRQWGAVASAVALAGLMKGPALTLLVLAVFAGSLVGLHGWRGALQRLRWPLVPAVVLGVAVGNVWVWYSWLTFKDTFIHEFFVVQNGQRFRGNLLGSTVGMLGSLVRFSLPWTPIALVSLAQHRLRGQPARLAVFWIVAVVVCFFPAANKKLQYVMPAVLAVPMLIATARPGRLSTALFALPPLALALAALGLEAMLQPVFARALLVLVAALSLGAVALVIAAKRGAAMAVFGLALAVGVQWYFPAVFTAGSREEMAMALTQCRSVEWHSALRPYFVLAVRELDDARRLPPTIEGCRVVEDQDCGALRLGGLEETRDRSGPEVIQRALATRSFAPLRLPLSLCRSTAQ